MIKKDGHTHTRYSHHGSDEPLEKYIERAIALGFTEYVVTEHAPLPTKFLDNFIGPAGAHESSAMLSTELADYKLAVARVQLKYANQIKIKSGFEIDYLQGYEKEIVQFIMSQVDWIDEIVLSVHFLPTMDGLLAPIDYEADTLATYFPEINDNPQIVFKNYLKAIQQSLNFAETLPDAFVVRIGHITLIRKYQKYFNLPAFDTSNQAYINELLLQIKQNHFQLDFNTAGISKPYNGEAYPTPDIVEKAQRLGIEFVYGSDAHQVSAVGQFYDIAESIVSNV